MTGPEAITREITGFLCNEVRLWSFGVSAALPWDAARKSVPVAVRLLGQAIADGLPAQELRMPWRFAEAQERNGEEALMAIVDALVRAGYPMELLNAPLDAGGWEAGPVKLAEFLDPAHFVELIRRLSVAAEGFFAVSSGFLPSSSLISSMLSRLSFNGAHLYGLIFSGADLEGSSFDGARFLGTVIYASNLVGTDFKGVLFEFSRFDRVDLSQADFSQAVFSHAIIDKDSVATARLSKKQREEVKRFGESRRALRLHPNL